MKKRRKSSFTLQIVYIRCSRKSAKVKSFANFLVQYMIQFIPCCDTKFIRNFHFLIRSFSISRHVSYKCERKSLHIRFALPRPQMLQQGKWKHIFPYYSIIQKTNEKFLFMFYISYFYLNLFQYGLKFSFLLILISE